MVWYARKKWAILRPVPKIQFALLLFIMNTLDFVCSIAFVHTFLVHIVHAQKPSININGDASSQARGYKTYFMFNSTEHENFICS